MNKIVFSGFSFRVLYPTSDHLRLVNLRPFRCNTNHCSACSLLHVPNHHRVRRLWHHRNGSSLRGKADSEIWNCISTKLLPLVSMDMLGTSKIWYKIVKARSCSKENLNILISWTRLMKIRDWFGSQSCD